MHVQSSGAEDGDPVLLLHGGGVAGWMWDSLRRSLEPTHRVLVPDLPGHGRSAGETYRSHAATVDALTAVLKRDLTGPTAVIGFSLGAQLAIRLASEHPQLVTRAMIVSAQALPIALPRLTLSMLGLAAPLARRRWFARLQARELFIPPELLEQYVDTSAHIARSTLLAAVEENLRFVIPPGWVDYPGPAAVLVGADERRLMQDSAAVIHAALPGSSLAIVDGCGHGMPLQRPEWFDAHVAAWLRAGPR